MGKKWPARCTLIIENVIFVSYLYSHFVEPGREKFREQSRFDLPLSIWNQKSFYALAASSNIFLRILISWIGGYNTDTLKSENFLCIGCLWQYFSSWIGGYITDTLSNTWWKWGMEGGRWSMSKKMWKVTSLDTMLPLHCLRKERRIGQQSFRKGLQKNGDKCVHHPAIQSLFDKRFWPVSKKVSSLCLV